jgi:hypothetical protein
MLPSQNLHGWRLRNCTQAVRPLHHLADCGATVFYTLSTVPDVVAVPIGAFAEPAFPPPTVSVFESRRYPWLAMTAAMEHHD